MIDRGVVRMALFHLRAFSRTSFFVQLMVTSTLSMVFIQVLGAYAYGDAGRDVWARAGMFGCWSTATVAAGIVGFQRFQGTLPHLLMTPRPVSQTIVPLVGSASAFGAVAFALAAATTAALGMPPRPGSVSVALVGVVLFWLGCFAITCVVAAVFVLSPHAITYEELLVAPLILVSGVFLLPVGLPQWLEASSLVVPTAAAARLLLDPDAEVVSLILIAVAGAAAWFALAWLALSRAVHRAMRDATLELL